MAGYIGINGVAKQIAGIYVGVNNVAKTVTKSYIGVNGVAKLWYATESKPRYIGDTGADLPTSCQEPKGGNIGTSYAMFVAGTYGSTFLTNVTAVNQSLVATYPTQLAEGKDDALPASSSTHFFVAGGTTGSTTSYSYSQTVEVYDSSLVKHTASNLVAIRYGSRSRGVAVGNYVVFAGSANNYTTESTNTDVDVYDQSLTHTVLTGMFPTAKNHVGGASVGNYALFAGGTRNSDLYGTGTKEVHTYDTSLTHSTATQLSSNLVILMGCSSEAHAFFAFGCAKTSQSTDRDNQLVAYDATLTKTDFSTPFSVAQRWGASTGLYNYAIFSCGNNSSGTALTEAYDDDLTYNLLDPISWCFHSGAGATVGDYALFTGGYGAIEGQTEYCTNIYGYKGKQN